MDRKPRCCDPAFRPGAEGSLLCPKSRTPGKPVELHTVKALLTESALGRLRPGRHAFCPDPACDVVYFTSVDEAYVTRDLRVLVWQKEPAGGRMLCYCFGEDEAGIRNEIEATGTSRAVERVRAHIEAGRCACEVRNPRGVCCLGNLAAAVRRIAATAAAAQEVNR